MAEIPELTLAFLESHPADAALELQRLPLETTTSFLQDMPVRIASPVLVRMLPPWAARCLNQMDEDRAAGFLRGMGIQPAAQVLRYMPEDPRNRLLDQLPRGVALLMGLVLGYPENTVGAWMDPQAPAVPPDMMPSEVLDRIRDGDDEEMPVLAVVGSDQRLEGMVTVSAVLRADPRARLAQIARRDLPVIPARAALASVREHPGWAESHFLPVVERQKRFVGTLGFGAMSRALMRLTAETPVQPQVNVIALLAAPVWNLSDAILRGAVALLPVGAGPADRGAGSKPGDGSAGGVGRGISDGER